MSEIPAKIGKYPVVREIGLGATSRVFLGRDPFAGRDVAIKLVSEAGGVDTDLRRRFRKVFLNEASLVGKLIHPHIMAIYDADVTDNFSYIVMEYVDGPTLDHYCEMANLLPIERVVEVAFKCSLALEFAHRQGVIHRDIKPANILISAQGDIKISDFGVALHAGGEHTHLQGVGSPAYMSPEQVQDKELSHQTDIYSLGVVIYQLLTGKLPFVAMNKASLLYQIINIEPLPPSVHRTDIPSDLDRVIMKALSKDQQVRYRSWTEFSRDLTQTYRHLELPADSISDTEKFNAIKGLPFFKDFRDVEVWETVRISSFRRIQQDKTVINEGDVGESFFVIASGEAAVTKGGKALNTLEAGHCFGEILYFEEINARRVITISSVTPLTVIEIKAAALQKASDACQKQFNKAFLRILIDRLTWANSRLSAPHELEAFLTSTLLVAVAEMGDKTQLLSFVLAARLRKPWPILTGILVATLANHAAAAWVGSLASGLASPEVLRWIVGLSFIGFGLWALHPDSLEGDPRLLGAGAFATALVAFFLAEMGDKTQFATIALAARYDQLAPVILGTTLGMMLANIPAVWIGDKLAQKIPMKSVRLLAAALFIIAGILTLWNPPVQ